MLIVCLFEQDEVVHRLNIEAESAEACCSAADRVALIFDPRASAPTSAGTPFFIATATECRL